MSGWGRIEALYGLLRDFDNPDETWDVTDSATTPAPTPGAHDTEPEEAPK